MATSTNKSSWFYQETVNLVALYGQSNTRPALVTNIQAKYANPMTQVWMWNGARFAPLDTTIVNNHEFPVATNTNFGAVYSLGSRMAAATGRKSYCVKYGVGGSSLGIKGGAIEDWNIANANENYDDSLVEWNQAVAWLEAKGKTVVPKGIVWIQGTEDSKTEALANAYQVNLDDIFNEWQTDIDPGLKFAIVKLYDLPIGSHPYHETVRAAQEAVAAARSDTTIIDTDSYSRRDVEHYDAAAVEQMGIDLFEIIKLW